MRRGGARKGAGRKKGSKISNTIRDHCEKFIIELLKDEIVRRSAIKQLSFLTDDHSQGYIYILESSGLYKIGFTRSIEQRIKQYQSHSNIKPIFIVRCNNAFEIESQVLTEYKKNIAYGTEWFKFEDNDLIKVIKFITNQILSNGWY